VAFNGAVEGPVPIVTATSAPDLSNVDLTPQSPEFLALQEQVGAGQDYSIMGNGSIEGPKPDGTTGPIEGIKLNPDGKGYTIMVNGAPVVIEADKVSITDAGISVDGYTFDAATGKFSEGFNLESWAPTTEHGAEFVSNLDLWNVPQEIQDSIKCEANLCYDADGKEIYDGATGQYSLEWLLKILPNSGDLGGPQYSPDLKGHPVDTNKSAQEFGVPTANQFLHEYKQITGEDYVDNKRNGRMRTVLCDVVNNFWCLGVGRVVNGVETYTHLIYRTRVNEAMIRSIPIKPPIDW
jgi:hypothetical protein